MCQMLLKIQQRFEWKTSRFLAPVLTIIHTNLKNLLVFPHATVNLCSTSLRTHCQLENQIKPLHTYFATDCERIWINEYRKRNHTLMKHINSNLQQKYTRKQFGAKSSLEHCLSTSTIYLHCDWAEPDKKWHLQHHVNHMSHSNSIPSTIFYFDLMRLFSVYNNM